MTTKTLGSLRNLAALRQKIETQGAQPHRLETIAVERIQSEAQPRQVFEKLDELAASLKALGQQQPIVVNERQDGIYVIEQGERRWRAAKLAGLSSLLCIVTERGQDDPKRTLRQLTENIQRDDMKLFELSQTIHQLIDAGMTVRAVARELGKPESYISNLNSVAEAPEDIQTLARNQNLQDVIAMKRLAKLFQSQPEAVRAQVQSWLAASSEGGTDPVVITRADVFHFCSMLADARSPEDEVPSEPQADASQSDRVVPKTQSSGPDAESVSPKLPAGCRTTTVDDVQINAIWKKHSGNLFLKGLPPSGMVCFQLRGSGKIILVPADEITIVSITAAPRIVRSPCGNWTRTH